MYYPNNGESNGAVKEPVPKLSILNIVIGKTPLTGIYCGKACIGNFPPVIGEGFFKKGTKLKT